MTPSTVIVMAKEPVPGRVKTRLCPPCSPVEAAAIAAASLADTLDAVTAADVSRRVLALDGHPGPWIPPGFEVLAQRGERFDERLAAAWTDAGGTGLLIGMDTPQLTAALLEHCLHAAAEGCAALGMAVDGGWWALSLADPCVGVDLFFGVATSRDDTGARQRERLCDLGFGVCPLPVLRDVDRFDDALAVAAQAPGGRFAAAVREVM